jgi:NADP-dependent 3-hydroxy acid dehydrogenase YdfG
LSETKVDEWERMIDINIKGVLVLQQHYQYLKNKNRGILLIYHPQQE